jgi:flagellar biosynthesis protein FliR
VPVTVLAQFKYLLCLIVFLRIDAHHLMLGSFLHSYQTMPTLTASMLPHLESSLVDLVASMTMLALQMAAPVAAVSFVVDAALGLVNRAVPQMPALLVGLPAKVLMGLIALSIGLPALVGTVEQGVQRTTDAISRSLGE